jgi:hypothetical protein
MMVQNLNQRKEERGTGDNQLNWITSGRRG